MDKRMQTVLDFSLQDKNEIKQFVREVIGGENENLYQTIKDLKNKIEEDITGSPEIQIHYLHAVVNYKSSYIGILRYIEGIGKGKIEHERLIENEMGYGKGTEFELSPEETRARILRDLTSLINLGWLRKREENGKTFYEITEKGEHESKLQIY
jgi:hypothetical protein